MALFQKKTPNLPSRREALLTRLQAAETKLATLRAAAVAAASAGTPLDAASAWQAQFDVDALQAALVQLDAELAAAAERERIEADRKEREATAKALMAEADGLEKDFAPFPEVMRAGVAAYAQRAHLLGASGLPTLLENLAVEIPNAIAIHAAGLRARAEQTLAGSAPASLPQPFVPEVVKTEPAPDTIEVFAAAVDLVWKDHRGQPQRLGVYQIGRLPVHAATIALQENLAFKLDDARYTAMREEARKTGWPHQHDPGAIRDLDRPAGTLAIYSSSGRKLRDEAPSKPFANIREHEPVKEVWIDRGPEPKPGGNGPNDFE